MTTQHDVLHALARKRAPFYDHETSKEKELYEHGQQCCHCRFWVPLEGSLGGDWGACVNLDSKRGGLVVFEHFTCERYMREFP